MDKLQLDYKTAEKAYARLNLSSAVQMVFVLMLQKPSSIAGIFFQGFHIESEEVRQQLGEKVMNAVVHGFPKNVADKYRWSFKVFQLNESLLVNIKFEMI